MVSDTTASRPRVAGLSKRYRTGDEALADVGLAMPAGQVLWLIGPSGAGKSTLIRCINRLVEPTAGRVFHGDTEITGLGRRGLRRARRRMGRIVYDGAPDGLSPEVLTAIYDEEDWGAAGETGAAGDAGPDMPDDDSLAAAL